MSHQQGTATRANEHTTTGRNLPTIRTVLLCVLSLALLASACSVDATSLNPRLAAATVADESEDLSQPASEAVVASVATGVEPSTTGATATTVGEWTDPGPGLPPSERCGIEPPLTIGRIGLALDLIVAAPAEYLDLSEVTEPYPDTAATVENGLLCLVVHDLAAGSISCGIDPQGDVLTPVRHEPLVITMVWILADATDRPVAQPTQKIYEDCDSDRFVDPLDFEGVVGEPRIVRPMIDAEFLRAPFDTGARFYTAQDPTEPAYTDNQCVSISVATQRLDHIAKTLLDALDIQGFWQPIPDGHVPSVEAFAAVHDAIDASIAVNAKVINGPEDATATLAQVAGLSNWMIGRVGTLAADHEQRDDPRFADHIAWQMGGIASTGLDPYETTAMIRAIAANRCSGRQLEAAENTDSACESLAQAYEARVRFRAALDVEPDLRRQLTWYLNVLDPHGYGDAEELYADPRLDADGMSGMYYAERALARLVDEGRPIPVEEVQGYEERAQTIHSFAREHCPQIATVDLPSVFDIAPEADATEAEGATATFCTHMEGFLQLRDDFRSSIDSDPDSVQPISPEIIASLRAMGDETTALIELFDEQAAAINPDGLQISTFTFQGLYNTEQIVRLANFGPSAVAIAVYSDDDGIEPDNHLAAFTAERCPTIDATYFDTPLRQSNLPGPKVPAQSFYSGADELCPTTAHVLSARNGFRSRLADHLGGDPDAAFDAELYAWRADDLGFFLGDPLRAAFPNEPMEYPFEESLRHADNHIASAIDEDWFDAEYFDGLLTMRSELLALLRSACPDLANDLVDTADSDRALVAELIESRASSNNEILPTVMSVADTCSFLDGVFAARAKFRSAIAASDLDAADSHRDGLFSYALWDVETFPEGFDSDDVSSLSSLEDALYYRAAYDSPIEARRAAGDENSLNRLIEWTKTNCPAITVGLDLPSVTSVFEPPDPTLVAAAQAAYCSTATELFVARAEFRAQLDGGSDDDAIAAFARVRNAQQDLASLWDELYLFPNGRSGYGSGVGQDIANTETHLRQAAIGADTIPLPVGSSRASGSSTVETMLQICDPLDSSLHPMPPLGDVADALGLQVLQSGDEVDEEVLYCQDLLVAQTALHHLMAALNEAALNETSARADALGYAIRHDNVNRYHPPEGLFSEAQVGALPEGASTIPVHRDVATIMERALLGEPKFDDRYDLADIVDEPMALAPLAANHCDIPDHLTNVDISDAVMLFDLVVAQTRN